MHGSRCLPRLTLSPASPALSPASRVSRVYRCLPPASPAAPRVARCTRAQMHANPGACGLRCSHAKGRTSLSQKSLAKICGRGWFSLRGTFEQSMSHLIQGRGIGLGFRVWVYIAVLATWSSFESTFSRVKGTPDTRWVFFATRVPFLEKSYSSKWLGFSSQKLRHEYLFLYLLRRKSYFRIAPAWVWVFFATWPLFVE